MCSLTIFTIRIALAIFTLQTLQVVARNTWERDEGFDGDILGDNDSTFYPTPAPLGGLHGNLWGRDMSIAPRRAALGSGVYNALVARAVIIFPLSYERQGSAET
jgi:hypothetical protein